MNTLHTVMMQHFTLVYFWIKLTPKKFTKEVLIVKDQVKAAHFKPVCFIRMQPCGIDEDTAK